MSEPVEDLIARVVDNHPLQYAFESTTNEIVYHTENTDTPKHTLWDRFDRCPKCEQWSPCDVRRLVEMVKCTTK
jgi:hypothetical protein